MRPAIAIGLLVVLAAAPGCGGTSAPVVAGPWRVAGKPFTVSVLAAHGSRRVTSFGGPAAPLTYATTSGAQHRTTHLLGESRSGAGVTYRVATDEAGRTATIGIRPDGANVVVDYALSQPQTVAAVGFDLTAPVSTHFLGTGERLRWVDMRETVVPLKCATPAAATRRAPSSSRRRASAPGARRPRSDGSGSLDARTTAPSRATSAPRRARSDRRWPPCASASRART